MPAIEATRVDHIETRLVAVEKEEARLGAAAEKLDRLKVSGYVQARYQWHEDATFGVDGNNQPLETSRFYIRRARMKTVYSGKNAEYLVQIGSGGGPVTLSDAEATLVDTWTPVGLRLTLGQFKVPFGFEIGQPASEIELPERTLLERSLFPGERDRGLRLTGHYQELRFSAALINGNGVVDPIYTTYDQTSFKDLVARVGADFRILVLGVSGYYGHALKTTLGKPGTAAGPGTAASYARVRRVRLGADAQLYFRTPHVGRLIIRGELVLAHDTSLAFSGTPADSCGSQQTLGWYATVVQNVGERFGVALRVDQYDPNRGLNDTCAQYAASEQDRVTTLGASFLFYISENLRTMLAYEHLAEQAPTVPGNDIVTVQMQAKF